MTNDFVYKTFIQTTPQKVWDAITTPEFTRQYWRHENVSDWKKDSSWKHTNSATGDVYVIGKVLECDPPKKLVLSWAAPSDEKDVSEVTFEIEETAPGVVCLNVVHSKLSTDMGSKISQGWPRVLSNLKSLLETGKTIDVWTGKPSCSQAA